MSAGKANDIGIDDVGAPEPPPRDRRTTPGFSYVEVLVCVVIVGIAVIAALVGLRTTVISGRVGTERSQLLIWVNEGAEALHRSPHVPCSAADPNGYMTTAEAATVRDAYQATLNAVSAPDGLTGGSLLVGPPQLLSIDPSSYTERWDDRWCDPEFDAAALRITATSHEGTTVELEVVVDG